MNDNLLSQPTSYGYKEALSSLAEMEQERCSYQWEVERSTEFNQRLKDAVPLMLLDETKCDEYDYLIQESLDIEDTLVKLVALYAIEKNQIQKQKLGRTILERLVSNMKSQGMQSVIWNMEEKLEYMNFEEMYEAGCS